VGRGIKVVGLFIYCFTSCSRIFHLYGDVTITGEELQILGVCSALVAFEQGEILIVTRGLNFSGLILRTTPFCRFLRHTRGCGESILTRILTGPLSVDASCRAHTGPKFCVATSGTCVCIYPILDNYALFLHHAQKTYPFYEC
jgi:hypothetical protein